MVRSHDVACGGKKAHDTKKEAHEHKEAMIRKGEKSIQVYWCMWCEKYHVGHRPRGRKGGRRRRG